MEVVSFDSERWRRRGAAPAARHPSRALVRSRRHLDGHVRDVEAAIALLRHQGVAHVVLVGASFGGATVMTYGSRVPADGGVSLSGKASLPTRRLDALAGVRRLRVPLLIVCSRRDGYLPVSDALRLLRAAGSRDKRTALYPGSWHGWEIVQDAPYAARARALVLEWIRARFR
jgi:dienelactone hydrolase